MDYGGQELDTQLSRSAMTIINYSGAHLKKMTQLRSSIIFTPRAPTEPKSFDATHVTSSYIKFRGIILGKYLYSLKAVQMGYSTGGICMSGCFYWKNLQPFTRYWYRDNIVGDPPPPSLLVT